MIKINELYSIGASETHYIVYKHLNLTKCGRAVNGRTPLASHSTLEEALTYVLKYIQREYVRENDISLEGAIAYFRTMNKMVSRILREQVGKFEQVGVEDVKK